MKPLFYLQFRTAQFRCLYGRASVALAVSFLVTLIVFAGWAAALEETARTSAERTQLMQRPATPAMTTFVRVTDPDLPFFSPSVAVETFTETARDVGLPVDELTYAMEGTHDQPYLRYRISMSVRAGYPEVRRFVAALATGMPNVALDAIRCARENAAAPLLGCQLIFSAFYRREAHG